MKDNKILIRGRRTDNRLWKSPLSENSTQTKLGHTSNNTPAHVANEVITLDNTRGELAQYPQYHAATLLNPTKPSLLRAIQRNHLMS